MSTTAPPELTTTPVENFIATMKFIANNDLWDEGRRALHAAGLETICVSSAPIRVFRALLTEDLLANERLGGAARRNAQVIAECGCGVAMPGPPTPVFPTSPGAPDAGPDAHPPTVVGPDGG